MAEPVVLINSLDLSSGQYLTCRDGRVIGLTRGNG